MWFEFEEHPGVAAYGIQKGFTARHQVDSKVIEVHGAWLRTSPSRRSGFKKLGAAP
jgi:hypothetical protein